MADHLVITIPSIQLLRGDRRKLMADHLVITIPSIQLLELFDRSNYSLDDNTMQSIRLICHTLCIAVLGIMDRSFVLSEPGTITHPESNKGNI